MPTQVKTCDAIDASLMKLPCGDAGVPTPCNPWGNNVDDDLSFAMSDSCSACRDDDPEKLSSAKLTTCLAQVGSRGVILPDWFDTSMMLKIMFKRS